MSSPSDSLLSLVPVVPVVVLDDLDHAVPVAQALVAGGLPVIELTLRTPVALDAIAAIAAEVPDILVGAGTITCNYDGEKKHQTVIEEGAFIGSDSQLVAPVRIGKGAYVAAGSSITQDVPGGALGIARARQANVEGWAERKKAVPQKG